VVFRPNGSLNYRDVLYESAGLKYVGGARGGLYQGEGVLTGIIPCRFSPGFESAPVKLEGKFRAGIFVSGTITFANGDTYTGKFAAGDGGQADGYCIGKGKYRAGGTVTVLDFFDAERVD
jgi:hypothetical protein